jgi:hypothetical protein
MEPNAVLIPASYVEGINTTARFNSPPLEGCPQGGVVAVFEDRVSAQLQPKNLSDKL